MMTPQTELDFDRVQANAQEDVKRGLPIGTKAHAEAIVAMLLDSGAPFTIVPTKAMHRSARNEMFAGDVSVMDAHKGAWGWLASFAQKLPMASYIGRAKTLDTNKRRFVAVFIHRNFAAAWKAA